MGHLYGNVVILVAVIFCVVVVPVLYKDGTLIPGLTLWVCLNVSQARGRSRGTE